MTLEIRSCRPDEFRLFLETAEAAFGAAVSDRDVARFERIITTDRMFAAFEGDAMVGTGGSFPFTLTIPGGELAAGGVTLVGVLPTHRRRGALTRLMQALTLDARERGEPLAALWASEGSIYGRFGYGLATKQADMSIERDRARFIDPSPAAGRCRLLTEEESLKVLPDVYERVRKETPGMFARSLDWWRAHTLPDLEEQSKEGGPLFRALWEQDGRADAYALYRIHSEWSEGVPVGHVSVTEALATTPLATREIWRFIFGIDLVARVNAMFLPAEHPLLLMVTEPRRLRLTFKDSLWLRIIDVRAALTARRYTAEGSFAFELSDPLCPWNEGRWLLETSTHGGELTETSREPDLRLTAADLAACYLGGFSFTELVRAGRTEELTERAALTATLLFATERSPCCPEIF
ncbi:GNAT family N-acetyltransferase [soil metagenome]